MQVRVGLADAFGSWFLWRDLRTVESGPFQFLEPNKHKLLDIRFSDSAHLATLAEFLCLRSARR